MKYYCAGGNIQRTRIASDQKMLETFFFDPNSSRKLACSYIFLDFHFALGAFTLLSQEINWREWMVAKLARIFYNCGSNFRGELREQFWFPSP